MLLFSYFFMEGFMKEEEMLYWPGPRLAYYGFLVDFYAREPKGA